MKKEFFFIKFILFFVIFAAFSLHAADIVVESSLDNTRVGLNQNFTLTVDITGQKAGDAGNPQMPDLSDFAVYLGSSGTSQNIQIINGAMSVTVSHTYIFRAVTLGKFTIPAVSVSMNGKEYRSKPIEIEIVKSNAPQSQGQTPRQRQSQNQNSNKINAENLFLRVIANKRTAYVNEPVMVSYKLYTRVSVTQYGVNKLPNTAGFWAEEYDLGNQPKVYDEVFRGKKYRVAEIKRMALFPTDAGKKTISPMEIECSVRVQTRRRSVFDSFFDDPFFGRSVHQLVQSRPLTINVLSLPTAGKPADFSGLVGNFSISSFVDKTNVKTNDAISLKIEIAGSGNIKMIPDPKLDLPADFEQYPPKVSQKINRNNQGLSGSKTFEYVLVPRHPGEQIIKPVSFSYFDVRTRSYRTIRTKEIRVRVEKSANDLVAFTSTKNKEDIQYLGKDIRYIQLGAAEWKKITKPLFQRFPFYLMLFLPVVVVFASFQYRQYLDKLSGNVAYARSRKANRMAQKRLSLAKKYLKEETQKDFYREIANALLGFIGDKFNVSAAGIIADEVEELMRNRGVEDRVIKKYMDCLRVCDYQRFAPATAKIDAMKRFLNEAKQAIVELEKIV
ncbi:MAG: protein BatD [Calditrichaeota bacterium]|nr:protein BatD [Calditrichota bacterium]